MGMRNMMLLRNTCCARVARAQHVARALRARAQHVARDITSGDGGEMSRSILSHYGHPEWYWITGNVHGVFDLHLACIIALVSQHHSLLAIMARDGSGWI